MRKIFNYLQIFAIYFMCLKQMLLSFFKPSFPINFT